MNRVGPVFFALAFLVAACSEEDKQFLLTYEHPKPMEIASAHVSPADRTANQAGSSAPTEMPAVPVAPVGGVREPPPSQATAPIAEAAPGVPAEAAAAP